jgi:hypothetical protein
MVHEAPLEGFRISPQQDRLWSLQRGGHQPMYGNRCAFRIRGALDREALEAAWRSLVDRHEILRTHLHLLPGLKQPVQAATGGAERWLPDLDLTDRDLGLAVRALARHLLPEGAHPGPGAGVRLRAAELDRDQRLLLRPATAGKLPPLGRADPG